MYYLYRHIRLDKDEPFYIGIGTKANVKFKSFNSEYRRAFSKLRFLGKKKAGTHLSKSIKNNRLAYGYKWKEEDYE